jgi:hypothetical protein
MIISVNRHISIYSLHRNEIPKLDFETHRIKNEFGASYENESRRHHGWRHGQSSRVLH